MTFDKKYAAFAEASICSIALMVFSYFIHSEFPVKAISYSALVLTSYFFSRQLNTIMAVDKKIKVSVRLKVSFLYNLAGVVCGILLAIFYRWHLGISLLPAAIHYFVIIAAVIGATEELVFRGFIQEKAKEINGQFSVVFSAAAHTGYKCCLFLGPSVAAGIDILNLAFWTFLFGLFIGTIRHFSKSIFPAVIAHVLFDLIVYSEFIAAPWWVW